MDIVKRARLTEAEHSIWKRAIDWALKAGRYDAIKCVRVPRAHGHGGVRLVMDRILKDGRIELWVNFATTDLGTVSKGAVKRHVFDPTMVQISNRLRTSKADTSRRYHTARNQVKDLIQRSSKLVHRTVDLVRALPTKVLDKLTAPDTPKQRGTVTVSIKTGAQLSYQTVAERLRDELRKARTGASLYQARHALAPIAVI